MKNLIYSVLATCSLGFATNAFAAANEQNDQKARALYPQAVESFNTKNYKKTLTKISEIEKLLGGMNARLSYLRAKAAYALADYDVAEGACRFYFGALPKHDDGYNEMVTINESILAYRAAQQKERADAAAAYAQAEADRLEREAAEERSRKLQMQAAAQRRAEYVAVQTKIDEEEKQAFEAAQKTGTQAAYQDFIYSYPSGNYLQQAKREMNKKWPQPARVLLKSRYGYTLNGKVVVKAKYENASDFAEGLARVAKEGKYGFVNAQGTEVIAPQYINASNFNYGIAAVKNSKNEAYFIDKNGNKLTEDIYLDTKAVSEGLAACQDDNYLYGFVNEKGELKIQNRYNTVSWFKEGNCAVGKIIDGKTKYAYIDRNGKQLCEFIYDEAKDFQGGVARVKLNGKYGLVDRFGSMITCCDYDYISEFKSDGFASAKRQNLEVYLDKEGNPHAKVNGKYLPINF